MLRHPCEPTSADMTASKASYRYLREASQHLTSEILTISIATDGNTFLCAANPNSFPTQNINDLFELALGHQPRLPIRFQVVAIQRIKPNFHNQGANNNLSKQTEWRDSTLIVLTVAIEYAVPDTIDHPATGHLLDLLHHVRAMP